MDTGSNGRRGRWAAVAAVAASIAITVFAPLSDGPPATPADSEATTVVVDVEPAGPLGQSLMSQLRPATNADGDADGAEARSPGARAASPESVSAVVSEFAGHYLRFDYRATPSERIEALAPLATGELLDQLSTPLPPLLVDQLAATQQIATVEVLAVLTVHDNPTAFHVVVAVTTTDAGGVTTEIRGLDLTVARRDGAWLIGDVR